MLESEAMTGVLGWSQWLCQELWAGARVYGVRARVYGVGARVYGTLKIIVSAPVPFWVYWGWNWVGLGWDWVRGD